MIEGNPAMMSEIEEKVRRMSEEAKMTMDQDFEVDDEDEDDEFDLRLGSNGCDDDE
jgi:hypothetical protein